MYISSLGSVEKRGVVRVFGLGEMISTKRDRGPGHPRTRRNPWGPGGVGGGGCSKGP